MAVNTGVMLFELKIVMKLSGSIFFVRETDSKKKLKMNAHSLRPEAGENIPLGSQMSDLCF